MPNIFRNRNLNVRNDEDSSQADSTNGWRRFRSSITDSSASDRGTSSDRLQTALQRPATSRSPSSNTTDPLLHGQSSDDQTQSSNTAASLSIERVTVFEVMEDDPSEEDMLRFQNDIRGQLIVIIRDIVKKKKVSWNGGFLQLYKDASPGREGNATVCIVCKSDKLADIVHRGLLERQDLENIYYRWVVLRDDKLRYTGGEIVKSPYAGWNFFLRLPESIMSGDELLSYGQPLEFPGPDGVSSRCTLGGFVSVDGRLYGLTVGHLFETWQEETEQSTSGDLESNNERMFVTVQRELQRTPSSPAHSVQENTTLDQRKGLVFSRDLSSHDENMSQNNEHEGEYSAEAGPSRPYWFYFGKLHDHAKTDTSDWALIATDQEAVDPSSSLLPLLLEYPNKYPELQTSSIDSLKLLNSESGPLKVNIKSGFSDLHTGILRLHPTFWWLGSKAFDAYEIIMDRPLVPGDSGSWVMHNGKLCGVVVGALDSLRTAFMLGIENVFDSIKSQTGSENVLAVMTDSISDFTLPRLRNTSTTNVSETFDRSGAYRRRSERPPPAVLSHNSVVYPPVLRSDSTERSTSPHSRVRQRQTVAQSTGHSEYDLTPRSASPSPLKQIRQIRRSFDPPALTSSPKPMVLGGSDKSAKTFQWRGQQLSEEFTHQDLSKDSDSVNTASTDELIAIGSRILLLQQSMEKLFKNSGLKLRESSPRFQDMVRRFLRRRRFQRVLQFLFSVGSQDLCGPCRDLQLTVEDFVGPSINKQSQHTSSEIKFKGGSGSGSHFHGSLLQIAVRSLWCNLCRLILGSLTEQNAYTWLEPSQIFNQGLSEEQRLDMMATCRVAWEIDGQRPRKGRDHSIMGERFFQRHARQTFTRRLNISWSSPSIETSYLLLESSSAQAKGYSPLFLGKPVNTKISSVSMIGGWLKACRNEHGSRCNNMSLKDSEFRNKSFFSVVDLKDWKITRLPEAEKYTAISYTWGGVAGILTKRSNVRQMQKAGGVQRAMHELPPTIRDAMQLAVQLGFRYLWVDALCIVHDSPQSWELNAKMMGEVFNSAELSIMVMTKSPVDADPTKQIQKHAKPRSWLLKDNHREEAVASLVRPSPLMADYSKDVRLVASYPYQFYVEETTWSRRAWTFQEGLLAHRSIIIADGRIFYQCRSNVFREDIDNCSSECWSIEQAGSPIKMLRDIDERPLHIYTHCVYLYTQRKLSYKPDILNAFSGAGSHIGRLLGNQGLLYGLPRSHFDLALLWQLGSTGDFRDSISGPLYFPSWSWCGWKDTFAFYDYFMTHEIMTDVRGWFKNRTWIIWYVRDKYGNLRLVWNPNREPYDESKLARLSSKWTGYLPRVWKDESGTFDVYGRFEPDPRSKHPMSFSETLPDFPTEAHVEMDEAERGPPLEDPFTYPPERDLPLLQFWTFSAFFAPADMSTKHVSHSVADNASVSLSMWSILDCNNEIRGVFYPDRTRWDDNEDGRRIDLSVGTHRFIAISEAMHFSPRESLLVPSQDDGELDWGLFYVLLVAEVGGVHYRLGLGKVHQDAFNCSCENNGNAEWKEIILG